MVDQALLWPNSVPPISAHVQVPYKFVHLGETKSYVEDALDEEIDLIDAQAEDFNLHDIADLSTEEPDSLAMFVRPDNVREANETAEMVKRISPETDILAYGDLTVYLPEIFQENTELQENFDAVALPGDQERFIADFFEYQDGQRDREDLRGIWFQDEELSLGEPHTVLEPEEWGVPDLESLPLDEYAEMKEGHGGDEITFTVSRGCPYGCNFCDATKYYGTADRRRPVEDVIDFIETAQEYTDRFKFFSPNVVLDKEYLHELSDALEDNFDDIKWSATARVDLLDDEDIIEDLSDSGCHKVAMGVETLTPEAQKELSKQYPEEKLERVSSMMHEHGIQPKGLIMLGVPGEDRESIKYTFERLEDMDIPARPTSYTPFPRMTPDMDLDEIAGYDKRTYTEELDGLSEEQFFNLVYDPENYEEILSGEDR